MYLTIDKCVYYKEEKKFFYGKTGVSLLVTNLGKSH